MTTYSLRCRLTSCRHRRVGTVHPDDALRTYKCPSCNTYSGWRIENRDYNRRDLCGCGKTGLYPHRVGKHKFCDFHPHGPYNQAMRAGATIDDVPLDHLPVRVMKEEDLCPF